MTSLCDYYKNIKVAYELVFMPHPVKPRRPALRDSMLQFADVRCWSNLGYCRPISLSRLLQRENYLPICHHYESK